eukprot:277217-Prymnesium_polylepis.1
MPARSAVYERLPAAPSKSRGSSRSSSPSISRPNMILSAVERSANALFGSFCDAKIPESSAVDERLPA